MTANDILEVINEEEIIELLEGLVSIPSYPGIENQETAVAQYIHRFFVKEGIQSETVHVVDGRCNVIAKIEGDGTGKSFLLTGHTDTVAPYDMKDPFKLINENGFLKGRGAVDMKGPLVCMMASLAAIKRLGLKLKGDLYFCGVIDEEYKSEGTIALLESGLKFDAAIVGEATALEICIAQKGLEWYEVSFKGKAVHGGRQGEGINAIHKAYKFIDKVENEIVPAIYNREHPMMGTSTMNYGFIKGGTQPSTVAGDCILKFDRRWIPGEKYKDVTDEYKNIIDVLMKEDPDFTAEIKVMDESLMRGGYVHESMEIDAEHYLVKSLSKNIELVTQEKCINTFLTAWSDAGLLSTYGKIPTVIFGPGKMKSAHTKDENIEIAQLLPSTLIYTLTAADICGIFE